MNTEIAWAAGIFEATGSIAKKSYPKIHIKQSITDNKIPPMIIRFYKAVTLGQIRGPYGPYSGDMSKKSFVMWYAGSVSEAQRVIDLLSPYLSESKIRQWNESIS